MRGSMVALKPQVALVKGKKLHNLTDGDVREPGQFLPRAVGLLDFVLRSGCRDDNVVPNSAHVKVPLFDLQNNSTCL